MFYPLQVQVNVYVRPVEMLGRDFLNVKKPVLRLHAETTEIDRGQEKTLHRGTPARPHAESTEQLQLEK